MKYLFALLLIIPIFLHANGEKNIVSTNTINNGLDTLVTKTSVNPKKKTFIYAQIVRYTRVKLFKADQYYVQLNLEDAVEQLTAEEKEILINPNTGKTKEFKNLLSAMNCMAELGWELTQTYVETVNFKIDDPTNYITWVIKREHIE